MDESLIFKRKRISSYFLPDDNVKRSTVPQPQSSISCSSHKNTTLASSSEFQILKDAIERSDTKKVKNFLQKHPRIDVNKIYDECTLTLLHFAVGVSDNNPEIVKLLLNKGGDPNNTNIEENLTPLHLSALYDFDIVMDVLIKFGGNLEMRSADGYNCYEIVRQNVENELQENCFKYLFLRSTNFRKSMGPCPSSSQRRNLTMRSSNVTSISDGSLHSDASDSFENSLNNAAVLPGGSRKSDIHSTAKRLFPKQYEYLMSDVKQEIPEESGVVISDTPSLFGECLLYQPHRGIASTTAPFDLLSSFSTMSYFGHSASSVALAHQPTSKSPANQPTTKSPANQPTSKSPANQPTSKSPANQPTSKSQANQPTSKSPANQPTSKSQANQPTSKSPANQPTSKSPANKPTSKSTANQPKPTLPTNQPTINDIQKLQKTFSQLKVNTSTLSSCSTFGLFSHFSGSVFSLETSVAQKYSPELQEGVKDLNLIREWGNLKVDFVQNLNHGNTLKSYKNYLLLNSKTLKYVNFSANHLKTSVIDSPEKFQKFLDAIFYIGNVKGNQPLEPLVKAKAHFQSSRRYSRSKDNTISKILEIWNSGLGVRVVKVFCHSSESEVNVNQTTMIDAMGPELDYLQGGNLDGTVVSNWTQKMKNQFGSSLLHHCYRSFLVCKKIKGIYPDDPL